MQEQHNVRSARAPYQPPRLEKLGSWKHLTQVPKSGNGRP